MGEGEEGLSQAPRPPRENSRAGATLNHTGTAEGPLAFLKQTSIAPQPGQQWPMGLSLSHMLVPRKLQVFMALLPDLNDAMACLGHHQLANSIFFSPFHFFVFLANSF